MEFLIQKINEFLQPLYEYLLGGLSLSNTKNILDGELLKLNLTWNELPSLITVFLTALFIVLVVKLIMKILGVFIWR